MKTKTKKQDTVVFWIIFIAGLFIGFMLYATLLIISNQTYKDGYDSGYSNCSANNMTYFNQGINYTLNYINQICHPITCECAKNTATPCMAYCMECEK